MLLSELNVGSVVTSKSGGPKMTVESIDSDTREIVCKWFVGNVLQGGVFSPEILDAAEEVD